MAERTSLRAYMFFSFFNFTAYVFPAYWVWGSTGFLREMGVVDVAGCGPVHLVGGASALVATLMLKPRYVCCCLILFWKMGVGKKGSKK